ncbi:Membraneassociated guanylate kinase_ WW and PDZ domaincontaining protein 1like, partial [Caligus rogercresseyi]
YLEELQMWMEDSLVEMKSWLWITAPFELLTQHKSWAHGSSGTNGKVTLTIRRRIYPQGTNDNSYGYAL